MRLRYTPEALAELDEVLSGLAEHSPRGAGKVRERIKTIVDLLRDYPRSGQTADIAALRRVVARPYPYLIFYELTADEVVIIGVRHASRDPSTMPGTA